jgi:hypothetical protein
MQIIAGTTGNRRLLRPPSTEALKTDVSGAGNAVLDEAGDHWQSGRDRMCRVTGLRASLKSRKPGGLKLAIQLIAVQPASGLPHHLATAYQSSAGASQGLLRKPEVQSFLETPLAQMASTGWRIAIEGRHNSAAHDLHDRCQDRRTDLRASVARSLRLLFGATPMELSTCPLSAQRYSHVLSAASRSATFFPLAPEC